MLSIASITVRVTGEFALADFIGMVALATITLGAQRDGVFQTAARAAAMPYRVVPSADSSVAAR